MGVNYIIIKYKTCDEKATWCLSELNISSSQTQSYNPA